MHQGLLAWVAGTSESEKEVETERTGFPQVYDGEGASSMSFRGASRDSDRKPDLQQCESAMVDGPITSPLQGLVFTDPICHLYRVSLSGSGLRSKRLVAMAKTHLALIWYSNSLRLFANLLFSTSQASVGCQLDSAASKTHACGPPQYQASPSKLSDQ